MSHLVDHRYRIEQKLAVGGFGTIYRATDMAIGRQVALKILHRELAGDRNVVARFRRETAALAKLKSPNTLTLYDVGDVDDTLYFVMELLRGESLYDVFARTGPLPWRRLARIARGVCGSLREAHAHGIVHRDLKPANIFLEKHALDADLVKVLDFGIAKVLASSDLDNRDLTRIGQMIGTFDYMAPEQMIGGPCTSKSDVFTLGVVLYEMLTGSRPFGEAVGPAQMLMALMTQSPTPLTGVPSELARAVMKCLAREPQDRPDVDQLDRSLASVLATAEAAFGDADEPTLLAAKAPRPSQPYLPDSSSAIPAPLKAAPRMTQPRGSVGTSVPSVMVSHETHVSMTRTVLDPRAQLGFAGTLDVRPSTMPTIIARGSEASIAHDIELALAATAPTLVSPDAAPRRAVSPVARGDAFLAEGSDVYAPVRVRIASGTSPITEAKRTAAGTGEVGLVKREDTSPHGASVAETALARRAITLPNAPQSSALEFVRIATISLCLFGVGFLGALAIWSL